MNNKQFRSGYPTKSLTRYSSYLRFWHWSNTIVLTGSLLTVLVTSSVMETSKVAGLLSESFKKSAYELSTPAIKTAAQAVTDTFWFLHLYFGYVLAGLLVFRLLLEFFQIREQKLLVSLRNSYLLLKANPRERTYAKHDFLVRVIYLIFYSGLVIMVFTGLFIGYGTSFSFYNSVIKTVRQIHGYGYYFMLTFIGIHLLGVFLAEKQQSPGIVSGMINGTKPGSEN